MSTRKNIATMCFIAAVAVGLAACGGSSKKEEPPPPPAAVDLQGSMDLNVGTTTIAAGASTTVGRTTVSCPAGGAACVLTVMQDAVTGGYSATSTGGTPTVTVAALPTPSPVDLGGSTDLKVGTTTIAAGASTTVGRTTVSCPAGGDACVLMVAMDAVTGAYTATATGGMPTVTVAALPTQTPVDLGGSTDLAKGTTTIPAGTSVTSGRTTVACPAGGDACVLTVAMDAVTGVYTATSTGGTPTVTVAPITYIASLPTVHTLKADDTFTVRPGKTVKRGGVAFTCPAGGEACVVTIVVDKYDADLLVAQYTGRTGLTTMQVTPRGFLAFIHSNEQLNDLSDTILDRAQLPDLQQNMYHGSAATGGSGVTSSVTTHEDPDGTDPNVYGVSDIMVTVTVDADDPTRDDDTHRIVVVDTGANGTRAAPAYTYEEAVHKNGSTAWDGDISATATWPGRPADGWEVEDLDLGHADNIDEAGDIWTAYFQHEEDLPGGRTLDLDLRTDFVPGQWNHIPYDAANQTIARGAGGTYDEVTVDWDDVMFDDTRYHLALGGEVDLSTDGGEGLEGAYKATDGHFVRGRFVCVDGGAAGISGDNECEIDHQTPGRMSVSEGDVVVFLPYVHDDDDNWLAAGVWLLIPDDEVDGDYGIGAFVYGSDPVERVETANATDTTPNTAGARELSGTATYNGSAFGRYAEDEDIAGEAQKVGRFTADVELTADFGTHLTPLATAGRNNFGTIRGDVTNFMADGQAKADWDVNFERATIMLDEEENNSPPPAMLPSQTVGTALRFNHTASGHGDGGKALTGYWNGQFYGDPLQAHNDDNPMLGGVQPPWDWSADDGAGNAVNAANATTLPGSAAGTFGLTSERNTNDNYLLVIEGAFAGHQDGAIRLDSAVTTP